MFYFKIARLDTMRDDYLPVKRPAVLGGSLFFTPDGTMEYPYLRAVFPSVGGVKGPGRNGDKTF
jgi:hypothetical protein